jgi:hypothetical protein
MSFRVRFPPFHGRYAPKSARDTPARRTAFEMKSILLSRPLENRFCAGRAHTKPDQHPTRKYSSRGQCGDRCAYYPVRHSTGYFHKSCWSRPARRSRSLHRSLIHGKTRYRRWTCAIASRLDRCHLSHSYAFTPARCLDFTTGHKPGFSSALWRHFAGGLASRNPSSPRIQLKGPQGTC